MGEGEKTSNLKTFAPNQPVVPSLPFILEYNPKNNQIKFPIFKVEF